MSHTFRIKNKKRLFLHARPMTLEEILRLSNYRLNQYSFTDLTEQETQQILNRPLDQFECVLLGEEGKSVRGFELSYADNNYYVRVFTPSASADWHSALHFIRRLAEQLGSRVVGEDGTVYPADNITYDYLHDIHFGLQMSEEHEDYTIFCLYRPICFSKEMLLRIRNSPDPIRAFDEMIHDINYLDAYSARQSFYRDQQDNIFGSYALTQDTPTILPYRAEVEFRHLDRIKDEEVSYWQITLVVINGKADSEDAYQPLGTIRFDDFIKYLPKDKYYHIDGKYIVVEAMNRHELQTLLNQATC